MQPKRDLLKIVTEGSYVIRIYFKQWSNTLISDKWTFSSNPWRQRIAQEQIPLKVWIAFCYYTKTETYLEKCFVSYVAALKAKLWN